MSGEQVVIRPRGWKPHFEWLFPLMFLVVVVIIFVASDGETDRPPMLWFAAAGLASGAWLWKLIARRALLSDERLEYFNGYWSRGMIRRDIKGYREKRHNNGGTLVLEAKDPGQKPCSVPIWIKDNSDSAFWFRDLRNLDEEDTTEAEATLAADPAFGADPESRQRRADFLKRAIRVLSAVGFGGLLGYAGDWGRPWIILAAMAGPLLALLLERVFPGQLRFVNENGNKDPRPSLVLALVYPAFGLALLAYGSLQMVDIVAWLEWTVPPAALVLLYLQARAPALRSNLLVLAGVAVGIYAYCAAVLGFANELFDRSTPQAYATTVLEVSVSHGRRTTYHITVAPWGLQPKTTDITMPEDFYNSHAAGDKVCILVGRGLLGWRWYGLDDCPPGA